MREFPQDDDVDYDELKQRRADDRQSIREIKDAFSLNVGSNPDRLLQILQGTYRPPSLPGEPERITRKVSASQFSRGVQRRVSMADVDERDGAMYSGGPRYVQQEIPSKYAEIIDTLDRFKFAQDEERRKNQMKIVSSALRTALQELVLNEVAVNTKTAFKGFVDSVVKAPGGLKVSFNFDDNKFAVVVKGGFYGDETVCVHRADGKIRAAVMRIAGEDVSDLSESFEIVVTRIQ